MTNNNFAQIARTIDRRHPSSLYLLGAVFAATFALGNALALLLLL